MVERAFRHVESTHSATRSAVGHAVDTALRVTFPMGALLFGGVLDMNRAPHGAVGDWIRARACDMPLAMHDESIPPVCEVRNGHTERVQRYAVPTRRRAIRRIRATHLVVFSQALSNELSGSVFAVP